MVTSTTIGEAGVFADGSSSAVDAASVGMGSRQQLLIQAHTLRQQAAAVLKALEASRQELDAQLLSEQREDMVKLVSGKSALERAILDTRRMIDGLDRAAEEARSLGSSRVSTQAQPEIVVRQAEPEVAGRIGSIEARRWVAMG